MIGKGSEPQSQPGLTVRLGPQFPCQKGGHSSPHRAGWYISCRKGESNINGNSQFDIEQQQLLLNANYVLDAF